MKTIKIAALAVMLVSTAWAQDAVTGANGDPHEGVGDAAAAEGSPGEEASGEPNGDGIESPKTMSGMSILGNEEAPKALVIVPWKSSELGETISLNDTLDERAQPVDKEEFQRQLRFYEIRSGD